MSAPTAVQVRDVSVNYLAWADAGRWRRQELVIPALSDVNLELSEGDAIGVIGHNGSGKSTLLQVIAGLVPPSSGSVRVSSQPQLLGVRAALSPALSGTRNIELCCLALGFEPAEVDSIADEIAEFTELGDFLHVPVNAYSTGMMHRLSFSISAAARPQILLIDEALAVGDHRFKEKCLARLRELRADAGVVVLATHAMFEIEATCNRGLWIHEGRIEMAGDPDEVTKAYQENQKKINRTLKPS